MAILRCRLSGMMTLEASFVVGIILLIILYQIMFTLGLYVKTRDYGLRCLQELEESQGNIESMRLTRLALRMVGKDTE